MQPSVSYSDDALFHKKIMLRSSRDAHETFLAEAEAETEANNKKMCIFKLFKTWKLFEMYNLT